MPKPPLIENESLRQTVIAIVMGVAFVTCLLLAWLLSGASLI